MRHLLTESVKKFAPMFTAFRNEQGQYPAWVAKRIDDTEKLLKRDDRVIWALRWYRYIASQKSNIDTAISSRYQREVGGTPEEADTFNSLMSTRFPHWFSLDAAGIEKYVFAKQTPDQILRDLNEIEKQWIATRNQEIEHSHYDLDDDDEDDDDDDDRYDEKKQRRREIEKKYEIEQVMSFSGGWAWWDLNRTYCTREGQAMGHCGNRPSAQPGDTVLSLRKQLKNGKFRPSLTFILHKDGMLGEMKGRANEKPNAKYYDMIIALLRNPMVKGIVGGGYAADKNFSILDLPEEKRDQLIAEKPALLSINDRMEMLKGNPDEENEKYIINYLERDLRNRSFRYKRIDLSGTPTIIIAEWQNREKYIDDEGRWTNLTRVRDFFVNCQDMILDSGETRDEDLAEDIAIDAHQEYFDEIFDGLHYYLGDEQFILDGVSVHVVEEGRVVLSLSVDDYLHPSSAELYDQMNFEDDDEYADTRPLLERIGSLAETNEHDRYWDWSEVREDLHLSDDTAVKIAKYCFDNDSKLLKIIARMLLNNTEKSLHYHSRDPRQMSLDLK